jgi:hypothetical protein
LPGTEDRDSIVNSPTDDQAKPPVGEGPPQPGASKPAAGSGNSAGERIQMIIEAAEQAATGIIEDADAQARRYIDASRQRADALADERVRVMSDLTETLVRQAELVRRQSDELLSALDAARSELAGRIGQELSPGPQAVPQPAALEGQAAEGTQQAGPPPQAAASQQPEQPQPAVPPEGGAGPRVPHLQPVESERPDLQAVESPTESEAESPPQPASKPPPAPPPPRPIKPSAPPSSGVAASDGARLLAAQMAVAGSSREEIANRLRDEFGIQDAGPILDGILGSG